MKEEKFMRDEKEKIEQRMQNMKKFYIKLLTSLFYCAILTEVK